MQMPFFVSKLDSRSNPLCNTELEGKIVAVLKGDAILYSSDPFNSVICATYVQRSNDSEQIPQWQSGWVEKGQSRFRLRKSKHKKAKQIKFEAVFKHVK